MTNIPNIKKYDIDCLNIEEISKSHDICMNVGLELNPYVNLTRPPTFGHYYISCMIYQDDLDNDGTLNHKFWRRKYKIYRKSKMKTSEKSHIGFYYNDEIHTVNEGIIYFNQLCKCFKLNPICM